MVSIIVISERMNMHVHRTRCIDAHAHKRKKEEDITGI